MKIGDTVKVNNEIVGVITYISESAIEVNNVIYNRKVDIIEVISIGAKVLIFLDSIISYIKKWFKK